MELLERSGVAIAGKLAVVIGRSNIVGLPAAMLLLKRNATVVVVHSGTAAPERLVAQADIVVAAAGQAGMVKAHWVKPGAVVIDVGTNSVDDPTKKSGRARAASPSAAARAARGWYRGCWAAHARDATATACESYGIVRAAGTGWWAMWTLRACGLWRRRSRRCRCAAAAARLYDARARCAWLIAGGRGNCMLASARLCCLLARRSSSRSRATLRVRREAWGL